MFDDREVSVRTRALCDQRIHSFIKSPTFTKVMCKSWNTKIFRSCKSDYNDCHKNRIQKLENADHRGQTRQYSK